MCTSARALCQSPSKVGEDEGDGPIETYEGDGKKK